MPKVSVENCIARARAAAEGTGQGVVYEAVGASGREALIMCVASPTEFAFERQDVEGVSKTWERDARGEMEWQRNWETRKTAGRVGFDKADRERGRL